MEPNPPASEDEAEESRLAAFEESLSKEDNETDNVCVISCSYSFESVSIFETSPFVGSCSALEAPNVCCGSDFNERLVFCEFIFL